MKKNSSTIVAQATAPGASAISIIRISGPQAFVISKKIWQPLNKKSIKPRELSLGWIVEGNTKLDQAMCVHMPAPHSYTSEDVVEIHSHGAPVITQKIISLALENGASIAQPGEFTRRAYLNGKLDLTQAEAVGELIASNNATMLRLASKQLAGGLSNQIKSIKSSLLDLAAHESASLDFSEEDIVDTSTLAQQKVLKKLALQTSDLLDSSDSLAVVKNGYSIALVGLPNAGKSTLLNSLLGFDRAIVTTQAGTTRDTITESVVLGGVTINITDTAGLRDSSDKVEKIGITRSIEELKNSDTIVVLIEPGQSKATVSYLKKNNILRFLDKKSSLVVNTKSDSKNKKDSSLELDAITSIDISAKENTGLSNLKNHLQALATKNQSSENLSLLSTRQLELIKKLNTQIQVCIDLIEVKTPPDIVLVEYQKAISICNSLTGESVTQEVIDKVFSDFCIGK